MSKNKPENAEATTETSEEATGRWPVPAEWYWVRVADVGNVKLGRQLIASKRRGTTSTPYLRAANITASGLNLSEVLRMDLTEQERQSLKLAQGDILLGEASGSATQVGKSALWSDEIPGCCFQNTVVRFRPHAILPDYALLIFQYLRSSGVFARVSHGVGILHLGATRLSQLEMPIPSMAEQERIVAEAKKRLEHVTQAEAKLQSALKGIEQQVSAALEAAATGQIGVEGQRGDDVLRCETSNAPITDVDVLDRVDLPKAWKWVKVVEAGEIKMGRQRSPKHEQGGHAFPYLRVANVFEDFIDAENIATMNFTPEEQDTYKLKQGDILLNEGQSPTLVGRPAMYRGQPPNVCFQNHLIRFRPTEYVEPEFALIVFRHYLRSGVFQAIARWTTNIATLGLARFGELPFPLPRRDVQSKLVTLVNDTLGQLREQEMSIRSSLAGIEKMRAEVLSAAVSGGLSVREVGDEPPEAMITRIGPPPKEARPKKARTAGNDDDDDDDGHRELVNALQERGGSATAEELFADAGYDRDLTTEVAKFYLVLRDTLGKTVRSVRQKGSSSILEVRRDEA